MRLKALLACTVALRRSCFNTRRCDWRFNWFKDIAIYTRVSIPEGAIEGWVAEGRLDLVSQFQYPKVRLKVFIFVGFEVCFARFNTRRCDWRTQRSAPSLSIKQVSIPEGAIEGTINGRRQRTGSIVSIPEGAIEGNSVVVNGNEVSKFQYPKVRLKVVGPLAELVEAFGFQYPKVRLKVFRESPPNRILQSFNTRRCDWRRNAPHHPCQSNKFQYPKVRLKVTTAESNITALQSFNTRRCDWRHRQCDCARNKLPVSIPEGAIEGGGGVGGAVGGGVFQYPKVRLKGVGDFKYIYHKKVSIPEGAIEGQISY